MFCEKCGKPVPETSAFCANCGHPVKPAGTQTVPSETYVPPESVAPTPVPSPDRAQARRKRNIALAVIIPVTLALAVVAGLLIGHLTQKTDSSASGGAPAAPGSAGEPALSAVDAGSYPTVSITLACAEPSALTQGGIRVTEEGIDRPVTDFRADVGSVTFCYLADDAVTDVQQRTFAYTVEYQGGTYSGSGSYTTPHFEPAQIRLVSTDVSDYPVIRAYFRVTDGSGQTVQGLDSRGFVIQESVQGGAYLAREIRAVSSLDRQGLNIDLLADKSGSMWGNSMEESRRVMTEFVNSLDYAKGDKVEILAFDDIVQQMCYYTSDRNLLINGIRNMSPDGQTALYYALHDGIRNAALQGGARCVIAFTDGEDTEGGYTPQDIINYANMNQVPVYIVGVSGARADILRPIAENTGGRYWSVNDLNGLGQIYSEIYNEQQELYMVEYVSDATADPYSYRDMSVNIHGGGCRGAANVGFTPVRSVGNQVHTVRYELVKESLTWEQASQRCQEMGGHLATITTQAEEREIIALAEAQGVKYLWLGGYTSYDSYGNVFAHWVTGEAFSYSNWMPGEPSRQDQDGTPEWYLMLWQPRKDGVWSWNDQRNDPAAVVPKMVPSMGFVCEYENG